MPNQVYIDLQSPKADMQS